MSGLPKIKASFILVWASLIISAALPQKVIGTLQANGAVTLSSDDSDPLALKSNPRNQIMHSRSTLRRGRTATHIVRSQITSRRRRTVNATQIMLSQIASRWRRAARTYSEGENATARKEHRTKIPGLLPTYCVVKERPMYSSNPGLINQSVGEVTRLFARLYRDKTVALSSHAYCENSNSTAWYDRPCAVFSQVPERFMKSCTKVPQAPKWRIIQDTRLFKCVNNCTGERKVKFRQSCAEMFYMECSKYKAVIAKMDMRKGRNAAELAKIEAENSARDAATQQREAVIAWRQADIARMQADKNAAKADIARMQADKNAATMRVEKRCMRAFLQQVKKEVPCVGETVTVPDGMMIHFNPYTAGVEAYMCPSPSACKGMRVWKGITQPEHSSGMGTCPLAPSAASHQQIQVHGSLNSTSLCEHGYDASQPGCVTCEKDYGRNNMDPFICSKCGNSNLQWGIFFMKPIALFVVGLRGGMQERTESVTNDLLKICLGYGAVDSIVMQVLSVSKVYGSLSDKALTLLGYAESMSHATSVLYSPSIDCLLGESVGINKKLATTLAMPILLFEVWFVVACFRFVFQKRSFKLDMLVAIIVLGNQFLPEVTAGCMRAVPCFHTQKHGNAEDFLAYENFEKCENRGNYVAFSIVICSVCFAIGPCFWYGILKRDPVDSAEGVLPVAGKSLVAPPAQAENRAAHTSGTSSDVVEDTEAPHVIDAQDPQMLSEAAGSATRKDAHMEAALDFLTGKYKPTYRWWESFRLTRTMTVSMVAVLSPVSYCPIQHAVQFLCLMGLAMAAQLYCQPYHSDLLNKAENISLGVVNLAMVGALYVNSESWSATPGAQVIVLGLSAALLFICRSYLIILLIMAAFEQHIQGEGSSPEGAGTGRDAAAEHQVQDNKGTEKQSTASMAKAVGNGEADTKGTEKESMASMAKAADNGEMSEKV